MERSISYIGGSNSNDWNVVDFSNCVTIHWEHGIEEIGCILGEGRRGN